LALAIVIANMSTTILNSIGIMNYLV